MIRLGQISYINCEIFNYPIKKLLKSAEYSSLGIHVIEGVPSHLNNLFLAGEIDVAPISSFAYLGGDTKLLKKLSISSFGKVQSVLFFINEDMAEIKAKLDSGTRHKIYLSSESASSVALLKILLKEKYLFNLQNLDFISFSGEGRDLPNKLLIGDLALKELCRGRESYYKRTLDLGEEWFDFTHGLPMVFGVWAHRLKVQDEKRVQELILTAKTMGLNQDFNEIVERVHLQTGLSQQVLRNYYQHLNYDFTDEHSRGLALYGEKLSGSLRLQADSL